jgi:hypothetical protein
MRGKMRRPALAYYLSLWERVRVRVVPLSPTPET